MAATNLSVTGQKEMPVSGIYALLWDIFQPLLFGLIGAEIDIRKIEGKTIGDKTFFFFSNYMIYRVVSK